MSLDLDRVTKAHINIRDARSALRKQYEDADADLKASQIKLENVMLGHLQQNNMESVRTSAGTFYRQEEITPNASDWAAFYKWIKENDGFEFLERRVKKTAIKEHMELNEGALPPGISVFREFVVRVRRPAS